MSLGRWLSAVAVACGLASGCAAAGSTDDGTGDDDAGTVGPVADAAHKDGALPRDGAAAIDAGEGSDTGGGTQGDAAETPDTSGQTGNDGATGADGAADATTHDAALPDTSVADTNVPDTNIPDTNVPDTNVPDTSVADSGTCTPVLSGFTPTYHSPPANQHACTASSVQSFYDQCLGTASTTATCSAWQTSASLLCNQCLTGNLSPTGTLWGPLVQYTNYVYSNQGGCVAIDKPTKSACAHDIEYQLECEHAACDKGCTNASQTDYDACTTAADNGVCATYANAVSTDCAGFTSVCFGGADFQANFKQVAAVFCE